MKSLIAAALLLALIVPAHASKFRESDRKTCHEYEFGDAAASCLRGNYDDEENHAKVCKKMDYEPTGNLDSHSGGENH